MRWFLSILVIAIALQLCACKEDDSSDGINVDVFKTIYRGADVLWQMVADPFSWKKVYCTNAKEEEFDVDKLVEVIPFNIIEYARVAEKILFHQDNWTDEYCKMSRANPARKFKYLFTLPGEED